MFILEYKAVNYFNNGSSQSTTIKIGTLTVIVC